MESKLQPTKIKLKHFLILLLSVSIFSSCSTYQDVPYFQDLNKSQYSSEALDNYTPFTIQPFDQISINVGSLNPEASAVFNNNNQNAGNNPDNPTYGYQVNEEGEIWLPLLGKMKVSGMSTAQLSTQLQQSLTTYLKEPTVSVRVVNFKVAVLGDVLRPDVYSSPSERLTITEALAMAGDLNITAKRKDVVLVRERDGKREYIPIDLTSKQLFKSPYFYMKSNDLLVVTPSKLKLATVDTGYRNASLIISALSLIAITYSIIK